MALIALFIGCQKDLYEDSIQQSSSQLNVTIKHYEWKDLQKNLQFNDAYRHASSKFREKQLLSRDLYGFDVDTTYIIETTKGMYTSYTFKVIGGQTSETYNKNLLIEIDSLQRVTAKLLDIYTKPSRELDSIRSTLIYLDELTTMVEASRCQYVDAITITPCTCSQHHLDENQCDCGQPGYEQGNPPHTNHSFSVYCPAGSFPSAPSIHFANFGPHGNGGSHGGTFTINNGLTAGARRFKDLMNNKLTGNQKQFLIDHQDIKGKINEFTEHSAGVDANMEYNEDEFVYPQNIVLYVKSLIDEMKSTDLTLDPRLSYNSPVYVDISNLNLSTPEAGRFLEVYGALKSSLAFQGFWNLTTTGKGSVVIEFVDNLPVNTLGETNILADSGSTVSHVYNTIYLNRSKFALGASALPSIVLAKVLGHEIMHAALNVFLFTINDISIADLNTKDFAEVLNLYEQEVPGQTDHDLIVHHLLPSLNSMITTVKPLLITNSQNALAANPLSIDGMIFQPTNTIPSINSTTQIAWNWSNYIKYLSYNGLQNCMAFPTLITPNSAEAVLFNQYYSAGNYNFHP